jgi:hypothetical protein
MDHVINEVLRRVQWNERRLTVGYVCRGNCISKHFTERKQKLREDEEEDVSSYLMALRK